MTDIIETFYGAEDKALAGTDADTQKISRRAISSVLPLILKNDLTERQRMCLKLRYTDNLNQTEIARRLKISQPTVCRHLTTAKDIVNNRLSYCLVVLNRANRLWLDLENSDGFGVK